MPARSMHNFCYTYGSYRVEQVLEILNDGKPAPQKRIAKILGVSKSQVSQWLKKWIVWTAEIEPRAKEEADHQLAFDEREARQGRQRLREPHHAPILQFNEPDRRA